MLFNTVNTTSLKGNLASSLFRKNTGNRGYSPSISPPILPIQLATVARSSRNLLASRLLIDNLSQKRMPGLLSELDLTKQIDDKSDYRHRRCRNFSSTCSISSAKLSRANAASSSFLKAPTQRARAASSSASRKNSTRARSAFTPSSSRPRMEYRTITSGAFGRKMPSARRNRDLRPLLVRPRPGRARREFLYGKGMEARLRRDQRHGGNAESMAARCS